MGKREADGCAGSQLRVSELDGLWDQSWCTTVSKLVMKLDAIKLGRALATYISAQRLVRHPYGVAKVQLCLHRRVPTTMYRHGGPPDQRSPSNTQKTCNQLFFLLTMHWQGLQRPDWLHLDSLG
jgi:hypothetical protein